MKNKKRITKMDRVNNCEISLADFGKSRIVFNGRNTNGVESKVTLIIDEYLLPHMVRDIMKIGKLRLQSAQSLHDRIKSSVSE